MRAYPEPLGDRAGMSGTGEGAWHDETFPTFTAALDRRLRPTPPRPWPSGSPAAATAWPC
jgi:hypothetical protein